MDILAVNQLGRGLYLLGDVREPAVAGGFVVVLPPHHVLRDRVDLRPTEAPANDGIPPSALAANPPGITLAVLLGSISRRMGGGKLPMMRRSRAIGMGGDR